MKKRILGSVALLSALLASFNNVKAASIVGPSYPPEGGTLSYSSSGSPGNTGGQNRNYTNFAQTTGWDSLYFGIHSGFPPSAGLDGNLYTLAFSGVTGTIAMWEGITPWTNPDDNMAMNIPIRFLMDLSGLGANPWIASNSITGLDPGPGSGISVVADNSAGLDYILNVQFLADVGSGFVAINTVKQLSSPPSLTRTSFGTAFYSAVPEPSTALLAAVAGFGLLLRRRA